MARAAAGTPKALSNSMKARGLTKLRFYCQICQKANRDENGYKCHIESESHLRKAAALGGGSGKGGNVIDDFSKEFQDSFVQLLSRRFGTRRIKANKVYQEYIQERHHLHMNATKWLSLSEFVKHLGREGIAHVEETEEGFFLEWIDTSPAALARQDALQKLNRQKQSDEQRERKLLQQQIERAAAAEAEAEGAASGSVEGDQEVSQDAESSIKGSAAHTLERPPDAAPLKLGFSLKASTSSSSSASTSSQPATASIKPISLSSFSKPAPFTNVFRSTPAASTSKSAPFSNSAASSSAPVSSNAFKKASASSSNTTGPSRAAPGHSLTAAERLRQEEDERKRRMVGPQPSAKRVRL
ncbi:hypothetical protein OC846_002509 [Tilletia horrida]|uniref:DNA/RNA-binding protein Kin17 WH-like domain-containing protein n=1 Tax=Tilletia horrida TaxID=155126 RepID=A0AAN6GR39_9BASI|nr:hypothetical protein OC845_003368 [Tilletia horrida]KAK0553460.1 hypothetical protein OC846_002509 [Tilletia horrida]KAK0568006.1 hypothetical protein OC861_002388 [Tilletia horrida]